MSEPFGALTGTTEAFEFRIGEWLAQPTLNRLGRGATTVHLRPKLMDILLYLARRAGQVVPQGELLEAVWARRFMAESALTRCMAELRETLGDVAAAPTYIETITKRGYRLVARVEWMEPADGAEPGGASAGRAPVAGPGSNRRSPAAAGPGPGPCCGVVWGEREIALAEGENVIGRVGEATVRVSSSKVSRRHARIVVIGGRALLEDLGSKNGTYLWGRRVAGPTELSDGDEICIGRDVLVFRFCYPTCTTDTDAR